MTRICFLVPNHWSCLTGGSEYQAMLLSEYQVRHDRFDVSYVFAGKSDHTAIRNGVKRYYFSLENPEIRKKMGMRGKEFVVKNYSFEVAHPKANLCFRATRKEEKLKALRYID